jgi:hypothetical protein
VAAHARWPIVAALLIAAVVSASVPAAGAGVHVFVRDEDGGVLARVSLPAGGLVTLRYRNSLYGSLAEERFVAQGDALRLVELAADERAVLDEYYVIDGGAERARPGDMRAWTGVPRDLVVLESLAVAATDLGRRELIVGGQRPIELWRLVDDREPTVLITLEVPG